METIITRTSSKIAGTEVEIVGTDTHRVFLSFHDLCNAFGLNLYRQQKRIQEDEFYSIYYELLVSKSRPDRPRRRKTQLYLDYKVFPFWLLYLNSRSVKAELREWLIAIQKKMIEAAGKKFQRAQ